MIDAPVTLTGNRVRLEPLSEAHADGLRAAAAGNTDALWYTVAPRPDGIDEDIATRLAERDRGTMNPFAVRRLDDDTIIGETTFCNVQPELPRTEIGYTWLAAEARGTGVNAEAKLLLLGHAFDACGVIAVELRTHFHNFTSRRAIERLGAKQDGIFRNHRFGPDGTLRDTVVYSILPHEWPTVRTGLLARLGEL
ncbi:GNAT family N-acetyltransferase [Microbacterium sp. ZW T5_56]|uniref:GNAT family N-acetyltransferase n=1 Tax=Microbacterium sp. ZW T5_56 TaxID=3378081 RepID=UPI00385516AD